MAAEAAAARASTVNQLGKLGHSLSPSASKSPSPRSSKSRPHQQRQHRLNKTDDNLLVPLSSIITSTSSSAVSPSILRSAGGALAKLSDGSDVMKVARSLSKSRSETVLPPSTGTTGELQSGRRRSHNKIATPFHYFLPAMETLPVSHILDLV
jgi:hypothetical protein